MNKIGLQLFSVRDHFNTEEEARATFKKLNELGYSEAQTAGCYGFDYAKFREMANDNGIEIIGTHDDLEMMRKNIDAVIENHKKLGTTNVGVGDAELWTRTWRRLSALSKMPIKSVNVLQKRV